MKKKKFFNQNRKKVNNKEIKIPEMCSSDFLLPDGDAFSIASTRTSIKA